MAKVKYLLVLATVATFQWTASVSALTCSAVEDRCVPVMSCRKYAKRVYVNKEHKTNVTFHRELTNRNCVPEGAQKKGHICCPKQEIGCVVKGQRGVCLLQHQCPGITETPVATLKANYCGMHSRKPYYCCTNPMCVNYEQFCKQSDVSIPHRPPSAFEKCSTSKLKGMLVPETLCDFTAANVQDRTKVCCSTQEPERVIRHVKAPTLAAMPCGTSTAEPHKISNGEHAFPGEFPWMAHLVYRGQGFCSGTLIHPAYVLTAGHCVNPRLSQVRLGVTDAKNDANSLELQQIAIGEVKRNPNYDVALLRLSQPAAIDGVMVRPICLPLFASLRMSVPKTLTITGWGTTEKSRSPSNVLMKARTPVVVSRDAGCPNDYEVCIDEAEAQSYHCRGDSGGPYQALDAFNGSNRFVQYGVISHGGQSCNSQKKVGKGVLVGYVLDWILDNMHL